MNTVGFLRVLQLSPEPKLTMPRNSQEPSWAWQFSGPPESPCTRWGGCQREAREAGEGQGGACGLASNPCLGLSVSIVREAEKMWFVGNLALFWGALGCQTRSWFAV